MRALALAAALLVVTTGCSKKVDEPEKSTFAPATGTPPPKGPDSLQKEDVVVGTGPEAKVGDTVKVHYTGTLLKGGDPFDSSVGREPFSFTLGKGEVIKGWDQGVPGMKVGGKRKLTIPSDLAYGEAGSPPKIPGSSPLKFDVELIEVVGKK